MKVIELQDVTRNYQVGQVETPALRGVNLTIEEANSRPSSGRRARARRRCCN